MTVKLSTGLRNRMMADGSLKSGLDGGRIRVYSGTVPGSADASIGAATLLCTYTLSSGATGITFDSAAVGGVLAKNPSETWSGIAASTGTASFYRHVAAGDDGTESIVALRTQGSVASIGADLNMNPAFTSGQTRVIEHYVLALPTA